MKVLMTLDPPGSVVGVPLALPIDGVDERGPPPPPRNSAGAPLSGLDAPVKGAASG